MLDKYSGFLLVNKPSGPTSHDIIDRLRRVTKIKKIGHAGTLDPFASGLLIVGVGRQATREISQYVKLDKAYQAVLCLGGESDTYDRTGNIKKFSKIETIPEERIVKVLERFIGELKQVPPMFSAKKINGQRLYRLARRGKEVERPAADIIIHRLSIIDYAWPRLSLEIKCSSGTYIRSLAHDIGQALGSGAYLRELKRTGIGRYSYKSACSLDDLDSDNWQSFLFQ